MVSFWPWRRDDSSPASFEKVLSTLSSKITASQLLLDTLRQRSRRYKALWTLYTSFAYLLSVIILALVVGWRNWGTLQYGALAGSPLFIYLIRNGIATYYTYRIDSVTHRLEEQQTERAKTIDKLKDATKYNSTLQLLEKYGGATPQSSPKAKGKSPFKTPKSGQKQSQKTLTGPPATANIPRGDPLPLPSAPSTPQHGPQPRTFQGNQFVPSSSVSTPQPGPPEFAPNAFQSVPQYEPASDLNPGGNWYDRFLDVLLGEDETAPKNRIVLICRYCRLVNGQAPPGTKRMEDVGLWRCMACRGENGVVDEVTRIVKEAKESGTLDVQDQPEVVDSREDDDTVVVMTEKESADERGSDIEMIETKEGHDVEEETSKPRLRRPKSARSKA